jgi:RNA polymerase sigma factor (sigma-70 family)
MQINVLNGNQEFPERRDLRKFAQPRQRKVNRENDKIRGHDPQGAPGKEAAQLDRLTAGKRRKQLTADQIAAEDEEEIDTDPTETMPLARQRETENAAVVNDDNDDGEGTEKVETGLAFAILKARIDCGLTHGFIDTRNVAEHCRSQKSEPCVKVATRCRTPNGYLRSVARLDTERKLDSSVKFCLDRSVRVDDQEASRSAIGLSTQNGAVGFVTTHWSVVLEAQGESPAAKEALEQLCRAYWRPLYAFARRQGLGPEDAQDLIQEFFARLLGRRSLNTVRREKGRLRSYLLVSLKRFLAGERHRARGIKRYETGAHIPLDELLAWEGADFDLAETLSADQLYERRWALAVLEQVLTRLEDEYQAADKGRLFERLKDSLVGDRHQLLQAQIAAELGMTENAVKQAFHRFRRRYRLLLHEEIARTVVQPGDVESELRHLISVLRGQSAR